MTDYSIAGQSTLHAALQARSYSADNVCEVWLLSNAFSMYIFNVMLNDECKLYELHSCLGKAC